MSYKRGLEKRLTLSEKFSRLGERLKKPEWRKFGGTLFAGKIIGVGAVLLIMAAVTGLFFSHVYAADPVLKGNDIVNPLNTVWTLVAAFLVFGMQVGFTMLEAGFCRSRETVNVLMECVVDTCLCGVSCSTPSASRSCSATVTASSATHWFFLQGAPAHL